MAASEKPEKTAYVYMVRCAGGQLYTGWTNDPEARLKAHQSGKGAKYTRTLPELGRQPRADGGQFLYKPDCIRPCIYKLKMHKICIYLENNA